MSKFSKFMRENKIKKKNGMYAPTRSLLDENGSPLEWEFRHITSRENEILREECTMEVPVTGKPNMFRQKLKSGLYIQKMIAASVVLCTTRSCRILMVLRPRKTFCLPWWMIRANIMSLLHLCRSSRALTSPLVIRWMKQKTD